MRSLELFALRFLPDTGNGLYIYGPYESEAAAREGILNACATGHYKESEFAIEHLLHPL